MKNYCFLLLVASVFLFSSFRVEKACEYASSNINYVKEQTEKALATIDINKARYFAYKALDAIEKSKKQLEACGCDQAEESILNGVVHLKSAIKATSLNGTHVLLDKALQYTLDGLEFLRNHKHHPNNYNDAVLAMNTLSTESDLLLTKMEKEDTLRKRIDTALENYKNSLDEIVNVVNCKEAMAFVSKIYTECQQQLLRPELSEGKKYYYLRTMEISGTVLTKLEACQ